MSAITDREFDRLVEATPYTGRFKVQSVREFLASLPPRDSREYKQGLLEEERQREARLALQQQKIDEWQQQKAQMTEEEILEDELSILRDLEERLSVDDEGSDAFAWLDEE